MLAQEDRGGGRNLVHGDVFLFGLYTGMRRGEVLPLRWERQDLDKGLFRVEETKTKGAAGVAGDVLSARGDSGAAAAGGRRSAGGASRLGVSVEIKRLKACGRASGALRGHRTGGRSEGLVSWVAERCHHGGRKGVDAAAVADQAVGEPRAAGRRATSYVRKGDR